MPKPCLNPPPASSLHPHPPSSHHHPTAWWWSSVKFIHYLLARALIAGPSATRPDRFDTPLAPPWLERMTACLIKSLGLSSASSLGSLASSPAWPCPGLLLLLLLLLPVVRPPGEPRLLGLLHTYIHACRRISPSPCVSTKFDDLWSVYNYTQGRQRTVRGEPPSPPHNNSRSPAPLPLPSSHSHPPVLCLSRELGTIVVYFWFRLIFFFGGVCFLELCLQSSVYVTSTEHRVPYLLHGLSTYLDFAVPSGNTCKDATG